MTQTEKDILTRAMALCSRSEKTAYDLRQSMTRWGFPDPSKQENIITYLKENKFIDESRYATSFVRDKHRFNRWGKNKIRAMLRAKGIEDNTISEALDSISYQEYILALKEDLISKRRSIKSSNHFDLRGKLMRFAQSRGYETDLIYKTIDEIISSQS